MTGFVEFRVRVEELCSGVKVTCDDGQGGDFAEAVAPTSDVGLAMLLPYMQSVVQPDPLMGLLSGIARARVEGSD